MSKRAILPTFLLFLAAGFLRAQEMSLSNALEIMQQNSNILRQADKTIEIARAEKQKLNSVWYPFVTATGAYVHFSNAIEAKESMQELLNPFKESVPELAAIAEKWLPALEQILPGVDIQGMISRFNATTFSFPLLDQNISTIDAAITWPVFTGGKRIYANQIGKSMVASAELLQKITGDNQTVLLIERYYSVKLLQEVVKVQQQNLSTIRRLYNNALKLQQTGMINKAEMLVAKVAMEEAMRELESARQNEAVAQRALFTVLNTEKQDTSATMLCTSPFFMYRNLPHKEYFKTLLSGINPQLKLIEQQQEITLNQKRIAKSAYLPDIAVFGKQTIYSYQIPKNLSPRTVIGAGFVWNIFDGLNREKSIRIAHKEYESLELGKSQALNELLLLTDKLYSQITDAVNNLTTINTSIELARELVKIREKSFAEGMATSWEVVDAQNTLAKINTAAIMVYFQYDLALANLLAVCGNSELFTQYMQHPNNTVLYSSPKPVTE